MAMQPPHVERESRPCPQAVRIGWIGTIKLWLSEAAGYRPAGGKAGLKRIIEELPARPFLAAEDGVSMSLAGAQEKLPVAVLADGTLAIPVDGAPSTHILKPDARQLWGGVQNEALCMTLAGRCGLKAAAVTTGRAGGGELSAGDPLRPGAARRTLASRPSRRFLLGARPATGGEVRAEPDGREGTDPRRHVRRRAPDGGRPHAPARRGGLQRAGLQHRRPREERQHPADPGQGASLAPLYDVLCGDAWENVTRTLSHAVASKVRGDHILGRHWQRMAGECGFNRTMILRRIAALADRVQRELPAAVAAVRAMPAGDHPLLDASAAAIGGRCRTVVRNLAHTEPPASDRAGYAGGTGDG